MKKLSQWTLVAGLAAALTFLSGCSSLVGRIKKEPIQLDASERTWGSWLDDQTLETAATVNIQKADPLLKKARIKVISYNGTVLLIGQVPEKRLKVLAEQTTQALDPVKQVYNELTVGPPADLITQSNDSWLTTKIKASLVAEKKLAADRIKVNTEQGTVYLMGIVSPQEAQTAVTLVRAIQGVKKIVKVFEYVSAAP